MAQVSGLGEAYSVLCTYTSLLISNEIESERLNDLSYFLLHCFIFVAFHYNVDMEISISYVAVPHRKCLVSTSRSESLDQIIESLSFQT